MTAFPATEILVKRAAACRLARLPAVQDVTRPPGAKQANHETTPGNPRAAAGREIMQTNMGHDPNPVARIAPMDLTGGMAGSRAGSQDTHNTPNLQPGVST